MRDPEGALTVVVVAVLLGEAVRAFELLEETCCDGDGAGAGAAPATPELIVV